MFVEVLRREYVREPAGTPEGGQFAQTPGSGFNPKDKASWYRNGGGWNQSIEGEDPYGWRTDVPADYQPESHHKVLRTPYSGVWGGSHAGSSIMAGEAAKQMGIDGYKDMGAQSGVQATTTRMLQEIADDTTGSEEPLYHSFENVRQTVFRPGDTLKVPLQATAGKPESYGVRSDYEDQEGAPTVFVYPKGTPMVAYAKWPIKASDKGYDEGNAKEFGHVYSEAIVAGKFRVTKVETKYMGSQHSAHREPEGTPIHQIYGQVVHLEPLEVFDPKIGQWRPRG